MSTAEEWDKSLAEFDSAEALAPEEYDDHAAWGTREDARTAADECPGEI
jgi:hypothetical protein